MVRTRTQITLEQITMENSRAIISSRIRISSSSSSSSSSSGGSSGSTTNQDHWNAGTGADAGWGVPGYITGNPDWWKPGYGAPTQGN